MAIPTFNADEQRRIRANLGRWFKANGRDLPWRRTRDPYAILVSEMMLQQTQVATVIPYFERWMEKFPDVATLAAAAEGDVLHTWQGLG
ncbi:MAG: A/G-specific adenine glycosylase, partial [Verrucomicrobiota bacterium]|nr:A/G-specific adenine glycosylase [Verrucomicrobiota bacterium]